MKEDISKAKGEFRKKALKIRDSIGEDERKRKEAIIRERFKASPYYRDASCVGLYYSFSSEVSTAGLIEEAFSDKKKVFLPKCSAEEPGELIFYEIKNLTDVLAGYRGIMEPDPSKCRRADPEEIELLIVPGSAFDRSLNRMGYGKGFYDRFIRKWRHLPKKDKEGEGPEEKGRAALGLCFKEQIFDRIPSEDNDERLTGLLSDA